MSDRNKPKHVFGLTTGYCKFCGASLKDVVKNNSPCHREKNVTPISHTRAVSRNKNELRTPAKNNNPNPK